MNSTNPLTIWAKASLPAGTIDKISAYIDTLESNWEEGKVKNHEENIESFKNDVRDCRVSVLNDDYVNNFIFSELIKANKSLWRFSIHSMVPIQYIVYETNQHYTWHTDWMQFENGSIRKLSMTLMLNQVGTDYEGGSFEFQSLHGDKPVTETMELNKGDMLVFPSLISHRVLPVTSGIRKVLVGWACGPMWT
jgi:PKHD-type hydroxylase